MEKRYKLTIKTRDGERAVGSIYGTKLEIKEGMSNAKVKYLTIYYNNLMVYSWTTIGEVEVIEEAPKKASKKEINELKDAIKNELTVELKAELIDEIKKELLKDKKETTKKVVKKTTKKDK